MISNEIVATFNGTNGFMEITTNKDGNMKERQFEIQGKKIIPILTRYKTVKGKLHTRLLRDFSRKRKKYKKSYRRTYKK